MTPNDLVRLALKMAGVIGQGQTPSAETVNDGFTLLNMMLAQWAQKRWLLSHLVEVAKPCTGATTYTVGPSGDFDTARPTGVAAAFLRQLTQAVPYQVDTSLDVVVAYEDWAQVAVKQQPGFPQFVFLDTAAPLAVLHVWPAPSNLYELHLVLRAPLAGFMNLASTITLPAEYQEALLYNLAGRLRAHHAMLPDPTVTALAHAALNTIRNANAQIPLLDMPGSLTGGGRYNVLTDND